VGNAKQSTQIMVTGVNHHTAPLKVREQFSLTRAQVPEALDLLKKTYGRGVVVATCNRTEIYTIAESGQAALQALSAFFKSQFDVDMADAEPYLFTLQQEEAVQHLFRVASGLDSLILGESEVLGQVREAYSAATTHDSAGGTLTKLFHAALRVGKRARTETAIGRNAMSVSRASVETARRLLGDLRQRKALVVGVGEASKLAARALRDAGVEWLVVTNRTPQRAEELASDLEATVAPLDKLPELLAQADIVVTSTAAPEYLIDPLLLGEVMPHRKNRPLFLMDLAVPRDVDPAVEGIPGVHLYDLDHLEMVAEANRQERETEARKVETIVVEEVGKFQAWCDTQQVTPTISAIHHQAEAVRNTELERTLRSLSHLPGKDLQRIEALSKALVKKLLDAPTRSLRDHRDEEHIQAARKLFGIDGE
jgi:glutamyl-tRNA reductase